MRIFTGMMITRTARASRSVSARSTPGLVNIPAWLAKQDDIPGGWLYIGDEKERYLLGQPGRRNMLVFGVNPSTASAGENNLDPTIKRVRKFVQKDPTCDGSWRIFTR
jgi:hypothetical protein